MNLVTIDTAGASRYKTIKASRHLMSKEITYNFRGKLWQHSSPAGWHFISLPTEMSSEIRENSQWMEEGWGRMKAKAKIGITEWETAIWFDSKHKTYLLPVKAMVRKTESLKVSYEVDVLIKI